MTSRATLTPARYLALCCFAGTLPCSSPTPNSSRNVFWRRRRIICSMHWLVVAAEPVTSVDVTAADTLAELDVTLHVAGTELCFAELKDPVKDKLKRFGAFRTIGERFFFPTIGAAVGGYLESHPVDWVDWKDRNPSGMHADPP